MMHLSEPVPHGKPNLMDLVDLYLPGATWRVIFAPVVRLQV